METLLPGSTLERVPTSRLTTAVLSVTGRAGYAAASGRYREVVIEDAGHGPHLDQPERFLAELAGHLAAS